MINVFCSCGTCVCGDADVVGDGVVVVVDSDGMIVVFMLT